VPKRRRREPPTIESLLPEIFEVQKQLNAGNDRATALVGGAYVQTALEVLLRKSLIDEPSSIDELFSENRPLGSFSSCIVMAYCMGLIGPVLRADLDTIRKIRNDFAHTHKNLRFEDDPISSRCQNFRHESLFRWNLILKPTTRNRFVFACTFLAHYILGYSTKASHKDKLIAAPLKQVEAVQDPEDPDVLILNPGDPTEERRIRLGEWRGEAGMGANDPQ
jgi:DNA-binding MltR family transcriptional regulator